MSPWTPAIAIHRKLARSRWLSRLMVLLASALLAACTTAQQADHAGQPGSPLWPQPLRSIGLAFHTASLAMGLNTLGAGPPAETAADAARAIRKSCDGGKSSVTWLGHSSVIISLGGRCIITDPILASDVANQLFPNQLTPLAARVSDLPEIDAVIFSHGDYDHLHTPSVRALASRFPDALVLAPPGVAGTLAASGYPRAREMREGESVVLRGVTVRAQPAYHESRRNVVGLKSGGALSWELSHGGRKILFIGDTAYGPAYSEIGRARGPFDVVLVPIGAYEPRHLVANMHVNPEEAVQIARDLKARLAIGIHWGTFALSPDRPQEAVQRFRAAGKRKGAAVKVLAIGEKHRIR